MFKFTAVFSAFVFLIAVFLFATTVQASPIMPSEDAYANITSQANWACNFWCKECGNYGQCEYDGVSFSLICGGFGYTCTCLYPCV